MQSKIVVGAVAVAAVATATILAFPAEAQEPADPAPYVCEHHDDATMGPGSSHHLPGRHHATEHAPGMMGAGATGHGPAMMGTDAAGHGPAIMNGTGR